MLLAVSHRLSKCVHSLASLLLVLTYVSIFGTNSLAAPVQGNSVDARASSSANPPLLDAKKPWTTETFWDNRDWDWYEANIPLFDCPDPQLTTTYYYRWELLTKHLVYGSPEDGYAFTEFIDRPFWSGTYGAISCPAGHQIYEARWLRSPQYVNNYIRYWYRVPGAEARKYSCWLADAAWAAHQVHPSREQLCDLLPAMKSNHEGWIDRHWVAAQGLFWQTGHDDGMELNIHSRQTKDAVRGAPSFRPTLNSYLWADAKALAKMARLANQPTWSAEWETQAAAIKKQLQQSLWDPQRTFFLQRYQHDETLEGNTLQAGALTHATGKFAGDTHGRELIGYIPWQFNLPDPGYEVAWKYLTDSDYFAAPYGPTTVERHDPMFYLAKHCCFWSGQSWPYATSQTLKAMANLLHHYRQDHVTKDDYVRLLQTYSRTHSKEGRPYLAEACDPDTGSWEGHDAYNHSEHYFHSSFVDLLITGLIGLQPQDDDTLVVSPLIPDHWDFFALENVRYRGHDLSIAWDRSGDRYRHGAGFHVWVDGKLIHHRPDLQPARLEHAAPEIESVASPAPLVNIAVNNSLRRYPVATASSTAQHSSPSLAIDGQAWYTLHPPNRWVATLADENSEATDAWLEVDFGRSRTIEQVCLAFLDDEGTTSVAAPQEVSLQYRREGHWLPLSLQHQPPYRGHTRTRFEFPEVQAEAVKVTMRCQPNKTVGVSEFECWGTAEQDLSPAPSSPSNLVHRSPDNAPSITSSFTSPWDNPKEAIDGLLSYRPSPRNRWTCFQSPNQEDWLEIDFPQPVSVGQAIVHLFDDRGGVQAPQALRVDYWDQTWVAVEETGRAPQQPTGGMENRIDFTTVTANRYRIVFTHAGAARSGVTEIELMEGADASSSTPIHSSSASDPNEIMSLLQKANRIVFLGDSITYAGESLVYLDAWLLSKFPNDPKTVINVGLPSETVSGLSEEGHAGGAFPRPDLAERLERVLRSTKPDLVIACYGMNCGIYLPLAEERFAKYRRGMTHLHDQVLAAGIPCLLITPPVFDDAIAKKDFSYHQVLDKYSQWLLEQRPAGWKVIDLHFPMSDELQRQQARDPQFTFQPDAVHPNDAGYFSVAKHLLRAFGEEKTEEWATPTEFLRELNMTPEIVALLKQRMLLRRDAYLTDAKHVRPGIAAGLPLDAAKIQDAKLTERIRALYPPR